MAIEVKHKFQSAKDDGTDATLVQPSNWNDEHDLAVGGQRLVGRGAAGQGAAQEITVSTPLLLDGTSLSLNATFLSEFDALKTSQGEFQAFQTYIVSDSNVMLKDGAVMTGTLVTPTFNAPAGGMSVGGQVGVLPHDYGNLSAGNITLNPANGLAGKITRNSSSNNIVAPTGTPTRTYTMIIDIIGTSSTGTPGLTGFDNTDFGDEMPGAGQIAVLYVKVSPTSKVAKIGAVNY
jgi:hypothetical protein